MSLGFWSYLALQDLALTLELIVLLTLLAVFPSVFSICSAVVYCNCSCNQLLCCAVCTWWQEGAVVSIGQDKYTREDLCFSLQETVFAMLVEITG